MKNRKKRLTDYNQRNIMDRLIDARTVNVRF